jgi:hypothetical protein
VISTTVVTIITFFFGFIVAKKATTIKCHRLLLFGFVATKKAMAKSCCRFLFFDFVTMKTVMTTSFRRLPRFYYNEEGDGNILVLL